MDIPELGNLIGLCVPQMGMHSINEEEMNATELFDGSMIVGFYKTETIFIEPMIARDKLLAREDFDLVVPRGLVDRGPNIAWPTSFKAVYDEDANAYQFVFSMGR
jgi:hypothetical protein